MFYTVRIADNIGTFTKRGYMSFDEAVNACKNYGWQTIDKLHNGFCYARVYDQNGIIQYDWAMDAYVQDIPEMIQINEKDKVA